MHADDPRQTVLVPVPVLQWSLLPSTVREILVWDDPFQAIRRQRELQDHQRWRLLQVFWDRLTPAERTLVRALVETQGTNKELAHTLGRDPKTVANQLQAVYAKFRACMGLPPTTQVRSRLIAGLTPVLAGRIGPYAHADMGERTHAARKRKPKIGL